jgi:hypothetical protein
MEGVVELSISTFKFVRVILVNENICPMESYQKNGGLLSQYQETAMLPGTCNYSRPPCAWDQLSISIMSKVK